MEIAEFLLARIAEDEAVARAATQDPWRVRPEWNGDVETYDAETTIAVDCRRQDAAHIARHDPARVLAECEAKRRIVESARHTLFDDPLRRTDFWRGARDVADADLRFLALPYADHPEYRAEWKP